VVIYSKIQPIFNKRAKLTYGNYCQYMSYLVFRRYIIMATLNISLPDPMRTWIQERIDEGKYSTSSDYVRDLIRRDQERKQKIEVMQQAITQGLESKDVKDFDINAFTKRMLKESQVDG